LLREAYRINKIELLNTSNERKAFLNILFTLTQPAYGNYNELKFRDINIGMTELLQKITEKIKK
jgi:hypothetical protein